MATELTLQFQYTEDEYVAATHAFYNRTIKTYIIAMGVILLAGLYLWYASGSAVVLIGMAVFLLILAIPLIFYFVSPRRYFRQEGRFHDGYRLHFTEEGIEFNTTHIQSQLDWKRYHQVWENKDFYLLLYGKHLFTVIPKRVFETAAQEAQFRDLIQRKIGSWE